ncbi:hypothetical protein VSQ48_02210 [Candidatus Ventrimonas sp. KK005]
MMNKFLKVNMNNKNSFICLSTMIIYGCYYELEIKIDTGCSYSTIPLKRLETYTEYELNRMKKRDIFDRVDYKVSYGVETGGQKHKPVNTDKEKENSSAIKFKHKLDSLVIGGYDFGRRDVYFNYNREGNILIGMDILSQMDIHMGADKNTGEYILIGCLKDNINIAYKEALRNNLGILQLER